MNKIIAFLLLVSSVVFADIYKPSVSDGREIEIKTIGKKRISFVIRHNGVVLLQGTAYDKYSEYGSESDLESETYYPSVGYSIGSGYDVIEYWNEGKCEWFSIRIQDERIDENDTKQRLRLSNTKSCKELKEYFSNDKEKFYKIAVKNKESKSESKPSFDCTKAKSKVEKMICEDSSGELQNLDSDMAKAYKKLRQNLNKNEKNELLKSQRLWIQTQNQCKSKECVREALQDRIKELASWGDSQTSNNAWLGTYELQENLYYGWFKIQKCDTNNICEIKYEAVLNKGEFNDMRSCEEVLMKLEIKNNNKAIAYYDGEGKCSLNLELTKNGILITEQKPEYCYMGCGVGTEISINSLYHKE